MGEGYPGAGMVVVLAGAEDDEEELGTYDDEWLELAAMEMTGSGWLLGSLKYVFLRSWPLWMPSKGTKTRAKFSFVIVVPLAKVREVVGPG